MYCTVNQLLLVCEKISRDSQEPHRCEYFSYEPIFECLSYAQKRLDRKNYLPRTSLLQENREIKDTVAANKSWFTVYGGTPDDATIKLIITVSDSIQDL